MLSTKSGVATIRLCGVSGTCFTGRANRPPKRSNACATILPILSAATTDHGGEFTRTNLASARLFGVARDMRDIAVVDTNHRKDQAVSRAVDQPFVGCHFVCHGARV